MAVRREGPTRMVQASSMDIEFKEGIAEKDAALVCAWSNGRGRAFHEQWVGSEVPYPLTQSSLRSFERIYSMYLGDEFLGIIQQMNIEAHSMHLGRFVINPDRTGQGYGKKALSAFMNLCFEGESIEFVSLHVLKSNVGAKRLYEKLGFETVELREGLKPKYFMVKRR